MHAGVATGESTVIGDRSWRLGVIGSSQGNGHPYSWSAICNGYDPVAMERSGYPVISAYLAARRWPEDQIANASVEFVWSDQPGEAEKISAASRVPTVCEHADDLLEMADAVLIARDDAVERREILVKAIASQKPVFVDKPFALTLGECDELLASQRFATQIFTTSALRYSTELALSESDVRSIGRLVAVHAQVPKYWHTYSQHVIDPVIEQLTTGFRIDPDELIGAELLYRARHADRSFTGLACAGVSVCLGTFGIRAGP